MNILEAISAGLTEITELSDIYTARIYIQGKLKYKKPVDIRLEQIKIPMRLSDIQFIYDNKISSSNIHKSDSILKTYFPEGSEFVLNDGVKLKVLNYSSPKIYNNTIYINLNCVLVTEGIEVIETIGSNELKEKVKNELNNIIESNEIIKNLLPEYSYNLLKYNDEEIEYMKQIDALKILKLIDEIDYDERSYILQNSNSLNLVNYTTIPTSIISGIQELSEIYSHKRIIAGFNNTHSLYNPRYVFEWIIYIIERNRISGMLDNKLYLLNKINTKTYLNITKLGNSNYEIKFITPCECNFNYKLIINGCISTGPYIKYSIDTIKLYKINKSTLITEEYSNISTQSNNLRCVSEIFGILSALNYDGMTLKEYYDNIDILINAIDTGDERIDHIGHSVYYTTSGAELAESDETFIQSLLENAYNISAGSYNYSDGITCEFDKPINEYCYILLPSISHKINSAIDQNGFTQIIDEVIANNKFIIEEDGEEVEYRVFRSGKGTAENIKPTFKFNIIKEVE